MTWFGFHCHREMAIRNNTCDQMLTRQGRTAPLTQSWDATRPKGPAPELLPRLGIPQSSEFENFSCRICSRPAPKTHEKP